MEDSLQKRYVIKLISNIVSGLINLLMVAIVPKELGPIAYGSFSYLQQFYNQIIAFLDASTSIAFFTKLSANNSRKELISFYAVFCIIVLAILYILVCFFEKMGYIEVLASGISIGYIYLGMWFGFLTWLTQVYIKISDAYALTISVELIKIAHKILMLGVLLLFINYLTFNLSVYFYFHFLSLISLIIVLNVLFYKEHIFHNLLVFNSFEKIIKEFYSFCSPLFAFNCITICIGIFDIWLLQKVSGSLETGYYGLGYSIAALCFVFTSAMTPVITREFSKSFEQKDMQKISELFKLYVPMLYTLAVFFSVFIAFEAKSLLSLFTDERFEGAYLTLVVIAFYPLHQTYGQINAALFFATEDTKAYRNTGLISSFIGLILSYLFIYQFEFGAVGFAWKMVISQFLAVNLQLYLNVRKLKLSYLYFLWHQVYSVLLLSALAYCSSYVVHIDNSLLVDLIMSGALYSILVLSVLLIFPSLLGLDRKALSEKWKNISDRFTNP